VRKGTYKRAHCSTFNTVKRASIRTTRKDYTQASFNTTVTGNQMLLGGADA